MTPTNMEIAERLVEKIRLTKRVTIEGCVDRAVEIVADALSAKDVERAECAEALRNVLIEADCHADKSGIVMWQDRVYGMCAIARAILAKIGAGK